MLSSNLLRFYAVAAIGFAKNLPRMFIEKIGKKNKVEPMNIAILLYEGLTVLDAVGAYEVLSLIPNAKVQFVAKEKGLKRSDNGFLGLMADFDFSEVTHSDVLLVPGSSKNTTSVMKDGETMDWIRALDQHTKWTTSVCSGALILGAAGLLKGKKATTHWAARDLLKTLGAEPSGDRIVEHGKIITAAGVSAGIDMALYLAARIAGDETAKTIQLLIEYDPQPPFDSGALEKASPQIIKSARNILLRAAMTAGT